MNASADTTKSERSSKGFNKHEKERLLMGFDPMNLERLGNLSLKLPRDKRNTLL